MKKFSLNYLKKKKFVPQNFYLNNHFEEFHLWNIDDMHDIPFINYKQMSKSNKILWGENPLKIL